MDLPILYQSLFEIANEAYYKHITNEAYYNKQENLKSSVPSVIEKQKELKMPSKRTVAVKDWADIWKRKNLS